MAEKGKILVIDDSLVVQNYMSKVLANLPDLEQCGFATNGIFGFQKIKSTNPDVVVLDLEMDKGNGLYVIKEIETHIPPKDRPYIIIHSTRSMHGDPMFMEAMKYGFCDFMLKIQGRADTLLANARGAMLLKIRSAVKVRRLRTKSSNFSPSPSSPSTTSVENSNIPHGLSNLEDIITNIQTKPQLLVIGASTGGPGVICNISKHLKDIKIPVVVIQHMPETFTRSFALELGKLSGLPSVELTHNMALERGRIHVFPGGAHGRLSSFGNLLVYYSDYQNYIAHPFKPSINLAIESLCCSFTGTTLGVILSGMGKDGALAMKTLRQQGSFIIAQDKLSSAVWGMPGSAVAEDAVDLILSEDDIGLGIRRILEHRNLL
ncbi:MAG: chemotaxis protein CheB [Brevinema sp.]